MSNAAGRQVTAASISPTIRRLNPQLFGEPAILLPDLGAEPNAPRRTIASPPPVKRTKSAEDRLNKTERQLLLMLRAGYLADQYGPYQTIRIQAITLLLANDCRYTPDFATVAGNRLTLWECKGPHCWEDSWVKFKAAAALFPELRFVWAQRDKGGEWHVKEVGAA